jgi:hypothetical protein
MSPTPDSPPLVSADWAALARAAAEARRFRVDGLAGCFGDTDLWSTASRRVAGQLERAISAVIDAAPERREDVLDALQAGDHDFDGTHVDEIPEDLDARKDALADLWPTSEDPPMKQLPTTYPCRRPAGAPKPPGPATKRSFDAHRCYARSSRSRPWRTSRRRSAALRRSASDGRL